MKTIDICRKCQMEERGFDFIKENEFIAVKVLNDRIMLSNKSGGGIMCRIEECPYIMELTVADQDFS